MSSCLSEPELKGFLESPGDRHEPGVPFTVSGWVFSRGSQIRSLELVVDRSPPREMVHRLPRPDVARVHSEASALASGFRLDVLRASTGTDELLTEVFAVLEDGRRVPCFSRRVSLRRPHWIGRVWRFCRVLLAEAQDAARHRRLGAKPAGWARALSFHWRETGEFNRLYPAVPRAMDRARFEESYRRWLASSALRDSIDSGAQPPPSDGPLLSIVALVNERSRLDALVESVKAQRHTHWELWLVCDGARDASPGAAWFARARDPHIHATRMADLTDTEGAWLPPGSAEYVVLLDGDSILTSEALSHVARASARSGADWLYTDDDRLDDAGRRTDPHLKGAFDPELALFDDYATRLAVVRRDVIAQAGGLHARCNEAQIYDLLLRIVQRGGVVRHVAEVGCHRSQPKPPVLRAHHQEAAQRILNARHLAGRIHDGISPSLRGLRSQRILWSLDAVARMSVTIVIPTRDRVDLLRRCVESLVRTVDLSRTRLLIVDDHSEEQATLRYIERLETELPSSCRVVRSIRADKQFNYSGLMNEAARLVDTELMLHLNNDVEAIASGWLEQMAGWFACPDIGVVGAKLLYPNGAIQHAGVLVSRHLGSPEHLFEWLAGHDAGYQWMPHRTRNVSAVTGACLLTRTDLFRQLGGFDQEHLAVQFNDIDYCLRIIASRRRVVYEASSVLVHRASASRGKRYDHRENLFFVDKYRHYDDPFVSPLLDPASLCGPTPLLAASLTTERPARHGSPARGLL